MGSLEDPTVTASAAKVTRKDLVAATPWLELISISYDDHEGVPRKWDAVRRPEKGPASEDANAVAVLPVLRAAGRADEVLLIAQFRPPIGKVCIEAPAGLVDPEEDAEAAARRELREETGLHAGALIDGDLATLYNDPGITNAACRLLIAHVDPTSAENAAALAQGAEGHLFGEDASEVAAFTLTADITLTAARPQPAPLRPGALGRRGAGRRAQAIRTLRLPLRGLRGALNALAARGCAVDGKLHCFARGLAVSELLAAPPGGA